MEEELPGYYAISVEAKSGGAAAVAIEFGDTERLRGVCLIRKFVSNCVQLL